MKLPRERHDVDMGQVPVPHFGVHLKKDVFNKIKANIEANKISYIDNLTLDLKVLNLSKIHFLLKIQTETY